MDRLLDHARYGPHYLEQAAIAELMVRCLYYGAETLQYYELHAFVVMPNHIHLLITPGIALPKLLCSLKTASAKYANRLLQATGRQFWQDESFDRLVRNDDEFRRIQRYIEMNPVRAGLVCQPEDYPWSSAGRPDRPPRPNGPPHN